VEGRDISQQTAKLGGKPKHRRLGTHRTSTNNPSATRGNALIKAISRLVYSTGRVQLGRGHQDSPWRPSFGLLATRRVGFLLPQLGSRLMGELPITRQGSYLLGIFLSLPLLPRSTHWPYWTYSHSRFLVCCYQLRLPSICHGLFLPVTDHFQLSRIVGTTCLLFATL